MNESDYVVRSAVMGDVEALAELMVESWQFAYEGLMPADFLMNLLVQDRADSLRRVLESNAASDLQDTRLALPADKSDEILGVCSFGPDRTNDSIGEVYALYVSPTMIGSGLGRFLFQDAVAQLSDFGFGEVFLWVLEGNDRAIRFYEKAGFSLTGETKTEELQGALLRELRMRKTVVSFCIFMKGSTVENLKI